MAYWVTIQPDELHQYDRWNLELVVAEMSGVAKLDPQTSMSGPATKRRRDSSGSRHGQEDSEEIERPLKISKSDAQVEPATLVIPEIASLLDFTSLSSASAISSRFDDIANALFRDYQLVVANGEAKTAFQILEMEFYLQKPGDHEDPFTHGSEEQRNSGQWYVVLQFPTSWCVVLLIAERFPGISIAPRDISRAPVPCRLIPEAIEAGAAKAST